MDVTIDSELDEMSVWLKDMTRRMDRDMAKKATRAYALEFLKRAIKRTPVDTGRARGGWTALMKMERVPIPPNTSGSKNYSEEEFRKGESESSAFVTDDYVEIINSVPYIVRLEYGHSRSGAPAGMVRISLFEIRQRDNTLFEEFEDILRESNRAAGWGH
jgi:hypothetical protein